MLDDFRPTAPELHAAERLAEVWTEAEAAYERGRADLEGDGDCQVGTRSELDLATEFLGDHQVVEALLRGERPLITYSVLAMPDGQTRAMFTGHTTEGEELRFAHCMLLDMIRRQLDRVEGEGEAARLLFVMAATATDVTTTRREDGTEIETVDFREQPGRGRRQRSGRR